LNNVNTNQTNPSLEAAIYRRTVRNLANEFNQLKQRNASQGDFEAWRERVRDRWPSHFNRIMSDVSRAITKEVTQVARIAKAG
jgi:hypothetical protein